LILEKLCICALQEAISQSVQYINTEITNQVYRILDCDTKKQIRCVTYNKTSGNAIGEIRTVMDSNIPDFNFTKKNGEIIQKSEENNFSIKECYHVVQEFNFYVKVIYVKLMQNTYENDKIELILPNEVANTFINTEEILSVAALRSVIISQSIYSNEFYFLYPDGKEVEPHTETRINAKECICIFDFPFPKISIFIKSIK